MGNSQYRGYSGARLINFSAPNTAAKPWRRHSSKYNITTQVRCAIQREKWEGFTNKELSEKYGIPEWLVATYPAWDGRL